jgi:acyl transferase domain-containing protein
MVSIQAGEDTVRALLADHASHAGHEQSVGIAAVNASDAVTISGAEPAVLAIAAAAGQQGYRIRRLAVSHAFHSPLMDPMLEEFRRVAEGLTYAPPAIPIVSAVPDAGRVDTAEHWVRHVRCEVRFADAVAELHTAGIRTYVEVGPDAVLTPLVARALPADAPHPARGRPSAQSMNGGTPTSGAQQPPATGDVATIATLRRDRSEQRAVLTALAQLHVRGVRVDWPVALPDARRVPLPTYAFRRSRYWLAAGDQWQPGFTAPAPVSADFWTAVDSGDAEAVAGTLELDDAQRAALATLLPALTRWRQQQSAATTEPAEDEEIDFEPGQGMHPKLAAALDATTEDQWVEVLLEMLLEQISATLGHENSATAVEPDADLQDLGFTSLMAVELRNRLTVVTGLGHLPIALVYDYPNATELAEFLRDELNAQRADTATGIDDWDD